MEHDETSDGATRTGVATNVVEAVVAAVLLVIGVVVIVESRRLGAGWTSDGPGSGYFPFYIGLIISDLRRSASCTRRCSARSRNTEVFVDREQLKRVLSVLVPAAVYVLAIAFLGLYVASAIYIALFMIVLGKYSLAEERHRRAGGQRALLPDVRGVVQGAAVQGHARSAALPRLLNSHGATRNGRNQRPDAGLRRDPDADEHRPDVRRHHPRRADRRAARPGRRQRRGHPAAAHLHDVADLGDHHAVVHLLGRAVRRRHHLDPVQHPGRAVVGGHHLRRLPDGAAGPRRRGADRRLHLVVHRRASWRW